MQDLLEQLELEAIRTKSKDSKYYRLRSAHLYRLLDLCGSALELKTVMDIEFFGHYLRRVAGLLTREIKLITKLTNMSMSCILDLNNLQRIFNLLQEEVIPSPTLARPATTIKTGHSGVFRVWLQRWINNHKDFVDTLPAVLFLVVLVVVMIITEH